MHAHIVDGEVVTTHLPATGILADGSHVSGYDRLPESTLKAEGWLPVDDPGPPEHNPETQTVERAYDVLKTKVNVVYTVVDLPPAPEPEPDRVDLLEAEVADLKGRAAAAADAASNADARAVGNAVAGRS
jgi:hypothetical protein